MASSRRGATPRGRVRALLLLLASPVVLFLLTAPAFAQSASESSGQGDVGDAHSPSALSLPVMIGLYVGIPAAGFVIAILLSMGSGKKSDRYRPGRPWEHDPAWFGSSVEESQEAQDEHR